MCRGELHWLERWIEEHPRVPVPDGDWRKEPRRCIGVADRPCGEEVSRRRKRCAACAKEQIRLNRRVYNLTYFRIHKKPANAARNARPQHGHRSAFIAVGDAEARMCSSRPITGTLFRAAAIIDDPEEGAGLQARSRRAVGGRKHRAPGCSG